MENLETHKKYLTEILIYAFKLKSKEANLN